MIFYFYSVMYLFFFKDSFFIWQRSNNYSSRIYRYTLDNFVLTPNSLWEFALLMSSLCLFALFLSKNHLTMKGETK